MNVFHLNGNIKSLVRMANGSASDNFTYTYTGNLLTSLSGVSGSFTYDQSGNLLNDPRKNLSFTYNSLNLPDEAKSGSTVKAKYLYAYDGVKVRVQDTGGTKGYDYLGSLTLVKTSGTQTPEIHFGDGIIRGTQVMYFEKDHLGSVRAVLNTSGTVLEKNDYYPFGMSHANASHVVTANNRYKFNGKEDQTVGALGLLDYGARMYDAQIARWLTVDPLADSYYPISPYVYCANDPVRLIDPNGMFFDDYGLDKKTGQLSLIKENHDDFYDYIKLGNFNEDGSFTEDETIKPFELPIGILRGDTFEDLSQYGIIVRDIELGVNLMEFISFNIYRELYGIGFESKHESKKTHEGLSIAPWMYNTFNKSQVGMLSWYIGTPIFYIHTHSGKEGSNLYGYGIPSESDIRNFKKGYDNYILSRFDGLTIYYRTGIYHKPAEKRTLPGLRKKIR